LFVTREEAQYQPIGCSFRLMRTWLILDAPGKAAIQIRNGEVDYIAVNLDKSATTAELSDDGEPDWKGKLTIQ